jgi:hypothetical protein
MNRILILLLVVMVLLLMVAPIDAAGATQISGIGYFAEAGECVDPEGVGSDFALNLTGDLDGCHYVFVQSWSCTPAGTYVETGTETYVGGGGEGDSGTFSTTYRFTAKFEDCANVTGELFGRCQHPIVVGSGTEDFEGVTGRIDFKDDIAAGNFPYTGHLSW